MTSCPPFILYTDIFSVSLSPLILEPEPIRGAEGGTLISLCRLHPLLTTYPDVSLGRDVDVDDLAGRGDPSVRDGQTEVERLFAVGVPARLVQFHRLSTPVSGLEFRVDFVARVAVYAVPVKKQRAARTV